MHHKTHALSILILFPHYNDIDFFYKCVDQTILMRKYETMLIAKEIFQVQTFDTNLLVIQNINHIFLYKLDQRKVIGALCM